MSVYLLPAIIILLVVVCVIKRVKVYDCFLDGAREGLLLIKNIFPYIATIFICIELFKESGLSQTLAHYLEKPLSYLGIPSEIAQLLFFVPMSGGGAIALLEDIINTLGVDSYPARCAAVISGATETIFYISAVYFSSTKIRRLRYAIPVALFCTLLGATTACALCRIM